MSRLHLRRIMHNASSGETIELSEEDAKKTIISLQGGKTFGRGGTNDVVLLADHENIDKEPAYISRFHARFYHYTRDGVEQYQVEDKSENGTYLNDRRLLRAEKELLKSGDTIKFGHRNGANIQPGEEASSPDAEFAFSVEMPRDDAVYRLLDDLKNSRVHVFSNSALSREFGTRDDVTPTVVQQQEADSTESDMGGASENGRTTHTDQQMPSTSQNLTMHVPPRAPHAKKFTDDGVKSIVMFLHSSRADGRFRNNLEKNLDQLVRLYPSLPKVVLEVVLSFNLIESPESVDDTVGTIKQVCEVLKTDGQQTDTIINELQRLSLELASSIHKADQADSKAATSADDDIIVLEHHVGTKKTTPAAPSAFRPPTVVAPTAVRNHHYEFLRSLGNNESLLAPIKTLQQQQQQQRQQLQQQYNSLTWNPLFNSSVFNPVSFQSACALAAAANQPVPFSTPASAATGNPTYLDPFRHLFELVPTAPPPSRLPVTNGQQEVPVIATAGAPAEKPQTKATAAGPDADEERHSASSTSSAHSRRRTESEESEIVIVDVESTDEPSGEKVALIDEQNAEANETPSPVLPEAGESPEAESAVQQQKIQTATEALRQSTTPRIDGQSTSSAVVSALPTPISSPLPRPMPSPVVVAEAKEDEPSQPTKPTDEKMDEVVPESEEKKTSDEEKEKEEEERTVLPETPKKTETTAASRRMKMKQLDESSVESDTEDEEEEKTPQKRKMKRKRVVQRRSVRTSGAKKKDDAEKGEEEDEEEDGDDEEEEKTPGPKPRGRRPAKVLKRTASQSGGRGRKAKSPAAEPHETDEKDEDEPPKKRRGRKKAVEKEKDTDSEQPTPTAKDKCGVLQKYCISYKFEGKKNLQWVECQECNQWYHVFCVRLDNDPYHTSDSFSCCGAAPSYEATQAISGQVHARWLSFPGKRKVPK